MSQADSICMFYSLLCLCTLFTSFLLWATFSDTFVKAAFNVIRQDWPDDENTSFGWVYFTIPRNCLFRIILGEDWNASNVWHHAAFHFSGLQMKDGALKPEPAPEGFKPRFGFWFWTVFFKLVLVHDLHSVWGFSVCIKLLDSGL